MVLIIYDNIDSNTIIDGDINSVGNDFSDDEHW